MCAGQSDGKLQVFQYLFGKTDASGRDAKLEVEEEGD